MEERATSGILPSCPHTHEQEDPSRPISTHQNLAPIWLPHWPPWRWTISRLRRRGQGREGKVRERGEDNEPPRACPPARFRGPLRPPPARYVPDHAHARFCRHAGAPDAPAARAARRQMWTPIQRKGEGRRRLPPPPLLLARRQRGDARFSRERESKAYTRGARRGGASRHRRARARRNLGVFVPPRVVLRCVPRAQSHGRAPGALRACTPSHCASAVCQCGSQKKAHEMRRAEGSARAHQTRGRPLSSCCVDGLHPFFNYLRAALDTRDRVGTHILDLKG